MSIQGGWIKEREGRGSNFRERGLNVEKGDGPKFKWIEWRGAGDVLGYERGGGKED